jgi:hypothetical protein
MHLLDGELEKEWSFFWSRFDLGIVNEICEERQSMMEMG